MVAVNCYSQSEKLLAEIEPLRNDAKTEEALAKVGKALKKNESSSLLLLKAEILFDLKQYQEVHQTYERAINLYPSDVKTLVQRGIFLVQYGKFEAGEADLNKALVNAKKTDEECYVFPRAGAIFGYLRQPNKSYELLIKAYECDSNDIDVLVTLGATCADIGKPDEAEIYLRKALEIDSSNFMIHGNLGFLLQEQEKHKDAAICFEKALSFNPGEPQTLGNLAYNQCKLGKLEVAMKNINKSIELYPTNPYAYKTRAMIHLAKGENKEACENIESALSKGYTKLHGQDALEFQKKNCSK